MRTQAGVTGTTLSVNMGMSSTAAAAAPFSLALKKPVLGLGFMLLVTPDIVFTPFAVGDAPPVPLSGCAPSTSCRSAAVDTSVGTRGLPWLGQEGKYSLGEPQREENPFPRELQLLRVLPDYNILLPNVINYGLLHHLHSHRHHQSAFASAACGHVRT